MLGTIAAPVFPMGGAFPMSTVMPNMQFANVAAAGMMPSVSLRV